ncbi:MAG: hypothetical protein IPL62_10960 [Caulobacteraceae bacterium]|nr:hypothetical protein [Caulobacteraceae bacterium]
MKHDPPLLTQSRAEAFTASALDFVLWVFGIIIRLGLTGRSKKLGDVLRHAERAVELGLFFARRRAAWATAEEAPALCGPAALASCDPQAHSSTNASHPRAKPTPSNASSRSSTRCSTPERAIAYFLKRIAKGLRSRRFVIAAPIAVAFFAAPAPFPQTTLDSS